MEFFWGKKGERKNYLIIFVGIIDRIYRVINFIYWKGNVLNIIVKNIIL